MLKTKIEEFLIQFLLFFKQLPLAEKADVLYFHKWIPLIMNFVWMGNL